MRILPYKFGSKSAKVLSEAIGVGRVKHDGAFRNNFNHVIINWGTSRVPEFPVQRWVNTPEAVSKASNKLIGFDAMSSAGVITPEYTADRSVAEDWLDDGVIVVARTKLQGHSGQGIVIVDPDTEDDLPNAPLYVKYIKKMHEYRFHVMNGEVIDVQQKRKRQEVNNEDVDYQVRNRHTGWVYCRDGIDYDSSLIDLATRAVSALGLDFGAVDIVWNNRQQQGYVLEVNTACGLEGQTLTNYVEAFRRHYAV